MKYPLLVIAVLLLLSSCVPNRKWVYLQKDDVHKTDVQRDTVLRTYNIAKFEYKVQPQDVLMIRFQSLTNEELDFLSSRNQMTSVNVQSAALLGELVDDNGEVNYPVIGKVKVAGYSVFEIQAKLQELAAQFLESPKVSVRLLNFRVTVLGEVNQEGLVPVSNNRTSMLEVMGLVGGVSDYGDKSRVKLIRQEGGKVDIQYLNLLDENFINSPYYYAHQNDVLVVPAFKQRPFRKYFGPNMALVVSAISIALLAFNLTK